MQHYQNQQSLLVSPAKKNPTLFKWKVGSLVLLILAVIFFLLCAAVILYLSSNVPLQSDFTFLNEIAMNSNIISTKEHIINLAAGLKQANHEFKFQFSQLFYKLNSPNSTIDTKWKWDLSAGDLIENNLEEMFRKHDRNILFVLEFQQSGTQQIIGIFVDTAFPMPQTDKFNTTLIYYTFDIRKQSDRQSTIVGISKKSTPQYLKYNGTVEQIDTCKVYRMSLDMFQFMNIMKINLKKNSNPLQVNTTESTQCFFPKMEQKQFDQKFKNLLGLDYSLAAEIIFKRGEVYYLS